MSVHLRPGVLSCVSATLARADNYAHKNAISVLQALVILGHVVHFNLSDGVRGRDFTLNLNNSLQLIVDCDGLHMFKLSCKWQEHRLQLS